MSPPPRPEPPPAPEIIDGPTPKMVARISKLVFAIGNVICIRSCVAPLTMDEATEIGQALAELAFVYGIRLERQLEAWIDAGGAVAGAAVPRLLEYKPLPAAPAMEITPEQRGPTPPPAPSPPEPAKNEQAVREARSFTNAAT